MTPNGGWEKYEKLFLADRETNAEDHKRFDSKLDLIITRMDRQDGANRVKMIVLNLGLPALVAVGVTLATIGCP